jgi:oligogalacturonide transporter
MLLPIVLLAFALIFAVKFPLTPAIHSRLNALLAKQRANEEVDEVEKAQLTKTLLG